MNEMKVYQHNLDWECSNFIGDEFIACSHGSPNTHKDTKSYVVNIKKNTRAPLLHKWMIANKSGLEDFYWIEDNYDWIWYIAERKYWKGFRTGQQNNMSVFRGRTGDLEPEWLFDIEPTNVWWQKGYSVSSGTFLLEGNILNVAYEGRYKSDVNDYHTGLLKIDVVQKKVIYRNDNPILPDRNVPDDFEYKNGKYRISTHWQRVPKQTTPCKWTAKIYESKCIHSGYKLVAEKEYVEHYFDGHYWKSNQEGMWKFISQPQNGGSMKPTNLRFENNVLSCDDIPKASRFDAYATGGFPLDLISSAYGRENGRVYFKHIQDKFILDTTQDYWIIADGVKSDILRVVREEEPQPNPQPNDNSTIVSEIRSHLLTAENAHSAINDLLDDLK